MAGFPAGFRRTKFQQTSWTGGVLTGELFRVLLLLLFRSSLKKQYLQQKHLKIHGDGKMKMSFLGQIQWPIFRGKLAVSLRGISIKFQVKSRWKIGWSRPKSILTMFHGDSFCNTCNRKTQVSSNDLNIPANVIQKSWKQRARFWDFAIIFCSGSASRYQHEQIPTKCHCLGHSWMCISQGSSNYQVWRGSNLKTWYKHVWFWGIFLEEQCMKFGLVS